MTSPPSLTDRLRSGSSASSISLSASSSIGAGPSSRSPTPTRPPQHRGLSKAYRPRYHSRSQSTNPSSTSPPGSHSHSGKPIVLPFPDLPVRPISRDGSRAGSPTGSRTPMSSPGWTPRGSSTNLLETARQSGMLSPPRQGGGSGSGEGIGMGGVAMRSGGSMDGSRSSSGDGRGTPARSNLHSQSTSPTFASPLASSSTPHLGLQTTNFRPRASTSPAPVDIPRSTYAAASASTLPLPSGSTSTSSYTSPTSPPTFSSVSPPQAGSGLGSRSGSAPGAASRLTAPSSGSNATSQLGPPTPEKDRPSPVVKPTKKLSTGSTTTIHPPTGHVPMTSVQDVQPLQDHLYRSFLSGSCADIRLYVREWGVGWHVHKMVLVQAGFFHSLFLGGFSEAGMVAKRPSLKGKERAVGEDEWKGEAMELRFDDPNITQEAFEICLARLYSPHPRLLFPLALLPTPQHPLTPTFPHLRPPPPPTTPSDPFSIHASPHLLLSLLAATIYLGHTPLMREVLAVILRTVGPATVGQYLGFALGDGCGSAEDLPRRASQGVARVLPEYMRAAPQDEDEEEDVDLALGTGDQSSSYNQAATHRDSTTSTDSKPEEDVKVGSLPPVSSMPASSSASAVVGGGSVHRTISNASTIRAPSNKMGMSSSKAAEPLSPRTSPTRAGADTSSVSLDTLAHMPHFYGFASDKIGEACACWLSRWGMDILAAEIELDAHPARKSSEEYRIFRHRGIPASFLRGLLASDSLWVMGEMERYEATREILAIRRKGWEAEWEASHADPEGDEEEEGWEEWDEDEEQLARVFAEGIYYSHMSFEDLSIISNDIDPTTNLPYAPLSVLQAAHWAAADLKSRVIAHDPSTAPIPSVLEQRDEAELGLTITASELAEGMERSMRKVTPRGRMISPSLSASSSSGGKGKAPLSAHAGSSGTSSSRPLGTIGGANTISPETIYHPIPIDDTHRAGAGGLLFLASPESASSAIPGMSGLPDLGPSLFSASGLGGSDDEGTGAGLAGGKKKVPPAGEKSWFGLKNGSRSSSEITSSLSPPISSPSFFYPSYQPTTAPAGADSRWTPTQPFRFSVEFWDVDTLPEKERLYSSTHFHAGSWWNVYVQTIRKKDKGTQLGVYLHRQSLKEGVPRASRPAVGGRKARVSAEQPEAVEATGTRVEARRERRSEGELALRASTGSSSSAALGITPPGLSSGMRRSGPSGSAAGSGSGSSLNPASQEDTEADMVGEETYKDARRVTRAYFSITCASALGTALIRFSSSPDSFTLSQSWGWKSSALRSEEYLAVAPAPAVDSEGALGWVGEIPTGEGGSRGSLRATVVVGVI